MTLHNHKGKEFGDFSNALQLEDERFNVPTPLFTTGITSIKLIHLKRNIEEYLKLSSTIPIITLMTNPTIRSLVTAIFERHKDHIGFIGLCKTRRLS